MPGDELANVRDQINKTYPSELFNDNQKERAALLIRDSSFTCDTRQLFDVYHDKSWMMNYNFLGNMNLAVHASDLLPTFCNKDTDVKGRLICAGRTPIEAGLAAKYINTFSQAYLSYLKSHAIHGDPNIGAIGQAKNVSWTTPTTSEDGIYAQNVMQP